MVLKCNKTYTALYLLNEYLVYQYGVWYNLELYSDINLDPVLIPIGGINYRQLPAERLYKFCPSNRGENDFFAVIQYINYDVSDAPPYTITIYDNLSGFYYKKVGLTGTFYEAKTEGYPVPLINYIYVPYSIIADILSFCNTPLIADSSSKIEGYVNLAKIKIFINRVLSFLSGSLDNSTITYYTGIPGGIGDVGRSKPQKGWDFFDGWYYISVIFGSFYSKIKPPCSPYSKPEKKSGIVLPKIKASLLGTVSTNSNLFKTLLKVESNMKGVVGVVSQNTNPIQISGFKSDIVGTVSYG